VVIVGQHVRARALVVLGISAALVLAGCGGGGSSKANSPAPGGNADASSTTTAAGGGGGGSCFQTPGTQTARVRFVNLFTNSTYPSGDIDVWQGFSTADACGKKLATIPFGTATDYIDVTASDETGNWSTIAYVAGGTDDAHQIISQTETWKGGEQVTIVFQRGSESDSGAAGGDQSFFEKPTTDINTTLAAVPGKALLAIGAASLQYTAKDAAWVPGAGGKCFAATGDTETTRTFIGGTSQVPYPVAPGSVALGLFKSDPGTCTGTPDIGPTTIDAADGSRTLVLAYGADAQNLKLLVLPVAS
jgi:hypothetical protein